MVIAFAGNFWIALAMLAILALLSDTCLAARRGAQTTETTAAGGRAQVL